MAQLLSLPAALSQRHPVSDAQAYILEKLLDHDIVFTGTVHQQPQILGLTARLLPRLKENGVTHLALEIASDQQEHIDRFIRTGQGLDRIDLHKSIDCPSYRNLFHVLGRLGAGRRPRVVAIDLPADQYGGAMTRNEYMAVRLASIVQSRPKAKILTMLGGAHVLRKLEWRNRILKGHDAIRSYLDKWHPRLRMFSLVHIVDRMQPDCDFSQRLAPLNGTVALDLDRRFKGWRLGVTACMALRPSQPYELVDGVIIFQGPEDSISSVAGGSQ